MKGRFLPKEEFEKGLKNFPMATFDLIVEQEGKGVLILHRIIEPYKNVWALPGLRKRWGETTQDVLGRIVKSEIGLELYLNPEKLQIIGQFDGFFKEERDGVERHDSSTGYLLKLPADAEINFNPEHFSEMRYIQSEEEIPQEIGAMYEYYLRRYFGKFRGE